MGSCLPFNQLPAAISAHRHFSSGSNRNLMGFYDPLLQPKIPPVNYGIRIVPEQTAFVVERFGKYVKMLVRLLSINPPPVVLRRLHDLAHLKGTTSPGLTSCWGVQTPGIHLLIPLVNVCTFHCTVHQNDAFCMLTELKLPHSHRWTG